MEKAQSLTCRWHDQLTGNPGRMTILTFPGGYDMKTTNIDNMIDTLRNYELTVALLYDTFSTVFPADSSQWTGFANEERMHARCLAELKQHHKNELISFNETKITIHSINHAITFVQEQMDKARRHEIGKRGAVLTALQIENSILETSMVKLFNFSSPQAKAVRLKLTRETMVHREKFIGWLQLLDGTSGGRGQETAPC